MTGDDFSRTHTYRGIGYERKLAPHSTILAALEHRAAEQPGEPYLTTVSADGATRTVSFAEFEALTRSAAQWVRGECGVAPGDVVGLVPANSLGSVVALFGVLRSAGACLMLSPADPVARWREQSRAQRARLVLRAPEVPGAAAGPDVAVIPEFPADPAAPPRGLAAPDPYQDMLLFGTSGSTAASKVVAQTHRNAVVNAEAMRRHHGLRRGDRLLGFLPIYHANAVHLTLFATLYAGAHAILPHGFDPLVAGRLVERFRPRVVSAVPSILEALLRTWRDPAVPAAFEYFVSAAAPLSPATVREVQDAFGRRILQGYGLTETTNFSTMLPRDLPGELYVRLMADAEIPSIGVPVFGNEVAVLDPGGQPLPPGEVGEICIRGHNVMSRYAGNREATAEAFREGWFHTEDLGYQVVAADRRFVVVTGRTKNIAKVRGEMVSLEELERVLCAVPGVRDAACLTVPDPLLGEKVLAAVAYAGEAVVDVLPALRDRCPPAAIPARVLTVDEIPRTATGKIRRPQLAEHLGLTGPGAR